MILEKSRKTTEDMNIVLKKGLSTLLLSRYCIWTQTNLPSVYNWHFYNGESDVTQHRYIMFPIVIISSVWDRELAELAVHSLHTYVIIYLNLKKYITSSPFESLICETKNKGLKDLNLIRNENVQKN